jgi:hypothetical protein
MIGSWRKEEENKYGLKLKIDGEEHTSRCRTACCPRTSVVEIRLPAEPARTGIRESRLEVLGRFLRCHATAAYWNPPYAPQRMHCTTRRF